LVELAVRTGIFLLYEVFDGVRYRVNQRPDGTDPSEYFKGQKRFTGEDLDLEGVRAQVQRRLLRLDQLASH
jgi:hypothetical protein